MLNREASRKGWRSINAARKKHSDGTIREVTVVKKGEIITIKGQIPLEDAIMENSNMRLKSSYGTPLMYGGTLKKDIGYLSNTDATRQILLSTYKFPSETDPLTISILNQFAEIFAHHQDTSFNFHITSEDYITYWSKKRVLPPHHILDYI